MGVKNWDPHADSYRLVKSTTVRNHYLDTDVGNTTLLMLGPRDRIFTVGESSLGQKPRASYRYGASTRLNVIDWDADDLRGDRDCLVDAAHSAHSILLVLFYGLIIISHLLHTALPTVPLAAPSLIVSFPYPAGISADRRYI